MDRRIARASPLPPQPTVPERNASDPSASEMPLGGAEVGATVARVAQVVHQHEPSAEAPHMDGWRHPRHLAADRQRSPDPSRRVQAQAARQRTLWRMSSPPSADKATLRHAVGATEKLAPRGAATGDGLSD